MGRLIVGIVHLAIAVWEISHNFVVNDTKKKVESGQIRSREDAEYHKSPPHTSYKNPYDINF